ncbi:energy transducer TonB [Luteibacter sp. SG786]|uniref:energy transducer TonB n=1 Tax=Luteibacter sp. SG786 TaxID=2587130 RepID=UPI0014216D77|nr:energy transducer TonB [Luteibacter sp. SG786]NII56330.1 protein TonB [Luteibacter sp. SG786]
MSFVRPQPVAGVHPDTARIVALSAAIALNAAALLAALRPVAATLSVATPSPQALRLIDHPAEPKIVPPPPVLLKPLPPRSARAAPVVKPVSAPPQVAVVPTDEGTVAPTVPVPVEAAPPAESSAPVEATLAYVAAPPPTYPRVAILAHMEGTVMLRVLVDEAGKPLEVVVEGSSGHAVLDKAAREQVLARWRFQPATAGGKPVRAWARIPVSFDLRKG